MDRKTISIVVTTLILAAIPLTVYLGQQRQQTVTEAAAATVLSVFPEAATKEIDDIFTTDLQISTGENNVVGVDLIFSFNPLVLEVQAISAGDFFDSPQEMAKDIDNEAGKITYSLASFASKQGAGVLATIEFKAKAGGTSSLTFDSGTSVAGIGETEALQSTTPGAVTVGGGDGDGDGPTPTPTPTPPGRGGPGPTSTPTPTPTSVSLPTPTPTTATTSGGTGSLYTPTATPTPRPAASGGVPETATPGPTTFISLLSLALVSLGAILKTRSV